MRGWYDPYSDVCCSICGEPVHGGNCDTPDPEENPQVILDWVVFDALTTKGTLIPDPED